MKKFNVFSLFFFCVFYLSNILSVRADSSDNSNSNTTTTKGDHLSTETVKEVVIKVLTPFGALGMTLNMLVVVTLFSRSVIHNTSSRFVLSLAISDLLMCMLLIVPAMHLVSTGSLLVSRTLCSATMYIFILLTAFSIYTITVISLDRYYGVIYPLRRNILMTQRGVCYVVIAVSALSFLIALPMLVQTIELLIHHPEASPDEEHNLAINMLLCHMLSPDSWYIGVLDVGLFALPLVVMAESYRRVNREVKNSSDKTGITVNSFQWGRSTTGDVGGGGSDQELMRVHRGTRTRGSNWKSKHRYFHRRHSSVRRTMSTSRLSSAGAGGKVKSRRSLTSQCTNEGSKATLHQTTTISSFLKECSVAENEELSSSFCPGSYSNQWPQQRSKFSTTITEIDSLTQSSFFDNTTSIVNSLYKPLSPSSSPPEDRSVSPLDRSLPSEDRPPTSTDRQLLSADRLHRPTDRPQSPVERRRPSVDQSMPLADRPLPSVDHQLTTIEEALRKPAESLEVSKPFAETTGSRSVCTTSPSCAQTESTTDKLFLLPDEQGKSETDELTISKDRLVSFLSMLPQSSTPRTIKKKSFSWPPDHRNSEEVGAKRPPKRSYPKSHAAFSFTRAGKDTTPSTKRWCRSRCKCCRRELFSKKNKAAVTLTLLLLMFLIFWMPYFVMLPTCYLVRKNKHIPYHSELCAYSSWVGISHSFVNPFVYAWARPDYRHALGSILCCKPQKPAQVVPENIADRFEWSYSDSICTIKSAS